MRHHDSTRSVRSEVQPATQTDAGGRPALRWRPVRRWPVLAAAALLGMATLPATAPAAALTPEVKPGPAVLLPVGAVHAEDAVHGEGTVVRATAAGQEERLLGFSVTISPRSAVLELEIPDAEDRRFELSEGQLVVDGEPVGSYEVGGPFERSWRELLTGMLAEEPGFRVDASRLLEWEPPEEGISPESAAAFRGALEGAVAPPVDEPVEPAPEERVTVTGPEGEELTIAPGRTPVDRLAEELERLRRALERLGAPAVRAAEDLALIVHDDYEIPGDRVVAGNLALLSGELGLRGEIEGDVLVLDGTLVLEPGGRVAGDVFQVGGRVQREGGRVAGELLSVRPVDPEVPVEPDDIAAQVREAVERALERERRVGPVGFFGQTWRNFSRMVSGLAGVLGTFLFMGLFGVLSVYFARSRLAVAAGSTRAEFGRSLGVGVAAQILFIPGLVILAIGVVTALVIPVYVAAFGLALLLGYLATAHAIGGSLASRPFPYEWMERMRRPDSPYYHVLSGVAVLLLPFALAEALHLLGGWGSALRNMLRLAGVLLTWGAFTLGMGAILVSRGGERLEAPPAAPPPHAPAPVPPGGPGGGVPGHPGGQQPYASRQQPPPGGQQPPPGGQQPPPGGQQPPPGGAGPPGQAGGGAGSPGEAGGAPKDDPGRPEGERADGPDEEESRGP